MQLSLGKILDCKGRKSQILVLRVSKNERLNLNEICEIQLELFEWCNIQFLSFREQETDPVNVGTYTRLKVGQTQKNDN